ncbi:hypothetical protein MXL54_03315 [Enterobacteriaceae bacterium G50]|nr:hypothetical protein [Enterobacteriaceae bacterium G50]
MRKLVLLLNLLFVTPFVRAINIDDAFISLQCPLRGNVEVILHHYLHTQERWGKDEFETGGGHIIEGSKTIFEFANLDQMIYDRNSGSFMFWYQDLHKLVRCQLLGLGDNYPVPLPIIHE